jgi:ABC-type sulfate/molybdate transport systems ATPase subunit
MLSTPETPQQRLSIMTAFQKPQALKAALKMALYGPAGSGKTFTSLRIAEGLAAHTGKRIAFVDTEHGTAFYGQAVPQRRVHP